MNLRGFCANLFNMSRLGVNHLISEYLNLVSENDLTTELLHIYTPLGIHHSLGRRRLSLTQCESDGRLTGTELVFEMQQLWCRTSGGTKRIVFGRVLCYAVLSRPCI